MSLRKSLYKQSSRAFGSIGNSSDVAIDEKYWVKEWYSPHKSKDPLVRQQAPTVGSVQSPSGVTTPSELTPQPQQFQSNQPQSQTPQPAKSLRFKLRVWTVTDTNNFKDCLDEDTDTALDLNSHPYLAGNFGSREAQATGATGLTDADIKSAVSGTGDGRLFSSSAAPSIEDQKDAQKDAGSVENLGETT
ncbi:hypothetical protein OGAPHI_007063 [Ogataea philodendri]|uniref:Uncharacterized protein n=1 Tax=Ogataea philodendri TaxID=1378263 RepID=A0A9P8NWH0_9ASCO|nr:uncharacterized protein OGAPHI_007063 [Ogataea philodendri]KAH3660477.1 hypothetical protein OGAPHI_007063 [Ogataea philodendri]